MKSIQEAKEIMKLKGKRRKANCIHCTEHSFCMSKEQLGDDCEGRCPQFKKGKYTDEIKIRIM